MSRDRPALGEPGLYHFLRVDGDRPVRFHLRVDPDGHGLLLANAAEAAQLSPVGTLMAHAVLEGRTDTAIMEQVREQFRGATMPQLTRDLEQVRRIIADLLAPDAAFPVSNFGAPDTPRRLMAPCQAHLAPGEPAIGQALLRALWDSGVPQVTLLAQPGGAADTLIGLVECAEDVGMIAGLRVVAGSLSEETHRAAAMAGLDYLVLPLASAEATTHDSLLGEGDHAAFRRAVAMAHDLELCPVAEVPVTDASAVELHEIVEATQSEGLTNLVFWALACPDDDAAGDAAGALAARALPQVATAITETAEALGARFLWAPPVRWDKRLTVADHVRRGPRAGGDVSVRVEADGTVYAPRGPGIACGNLLKQRWARIWQHPAFRRHRLGEAAPGRCPTCPGLALCDGGCVKDPSGWSDDTEGASK